MPRWKFEVTENGAVVAEGDAPDKDAALGECSHYVKMYSQDGGKVSGMVWQGRKPRPQTKEMRAINAELAALKWR